MPLKRSHQSFPSTESPFNSPNVDRKLQLETNLLKSFIFIRTDTYWGQWIKNKPSFIYYGIYHFLEIVTVAAIQVTETFYS